MMLLNITSKNNVMFICLFWIFFFLNIFWHLNKTSATLSLSLSTVLPWVCPSIRRQIPLALPATPSLSSLLPARRPSSPPSQERWDRTVPNKQLQKDFRLHMLDMSCAAVTWVWSGRSVKLTKINCLRCTYSMGTWQNCQPLSYTVVLCWKNSYTVACVHTKLNTLKLCWVKTTLL